ncbi:TPA: hypothetical protein MDT29_000870 [Klebsiella pneumoniae]|nr:hypothetical protein [Klebsiella pneumoniae]HBV3020931.1 hypothetical protein [Klebsiella pneumoniae]HBV3057511.1 hypothetical protein [Klebsiella pneumoniae]
MKTNRQKKAHQSALQAAAAATSKRWLGRSTLLTGIQAAWIKSLLTVWGECVGGKTHAQYRMEGCNRFYAQTKEEGWSDSQLARMIEALKQAREEGYTGHRVALRARAILWPLTLSDMTAAAERHDDADFIESVILKTFSTDDPVYLVGREYYTTRAKISDITRELQRVAPWLTTDEARKRVRWCLEIFAAKVFLAARSE